MSKFELQRAAWEASGVTYEESLLAQKLEPSLYERIGKENGFYKLSLDFYDRVFADNDTPWFVNIFSSSTKDEAVDNQYRFFVQTFGGQDLYRQTRANRWVHHMTEAIHRHEALRDDDEARDVLVKYFRYTAHYIVAARQYMRSDQLSGGTKIDSGRVW